MKQYTLILADSSEDFRKSMQTQFETLCNVHCCSSGAQVLETLRQYPADVLVLDLMLPEMDGISLLSAISAMGDCPKILAASSYVSPYVVNTLSLLGVSTLLTRPCSLQAAERAIRALLQSRDPDSREDRFRRISGILLRLGFSAKLRGYGYLRDAVLCLAQRPDQSIIKELYPAVAGTYGVTAEDVEHSIRSAAMDAWGHGVRGTWELYFGREGDGPVRPSNAQLIGTLCKTVLELPELPEALSV